MSEQDTQRPVEISWQQLPANRDMMISGYFPCHDDGEKITAEWLKLIGFELNDRDGFVRGDGALKVRLLPIDADRWDLMIDKTQWPLTLVNRGCVRRILIAVRRVRVENSRHESAEAKQIQEK